MPARASKSPRRVQAKGGAAAGADASGAAMPPPASILPWALFALACGVFAVRFFAEAFPVTSLDISMSRNEALEKAARLAAAHRGAIVLRPDGDGDGGGDGGNTTSGRRESAAFESDAEVQHFIELRGGGVAALGATLRRAEPHHHPFTWVVRHFRPADPSETRIVFTPKGLPWGFDTTLPERETWAGANTSFETARAVAEAAAAQPPWRVDFRRRSEAGEGDGGGWALVENATKVMPGPGGRVDHSLTYEVVRGAREEDEELRALHAGGGRLRLRLRVCGDRLAGVHRFVKIPQAFKRDYAAMRSANAAVGSLAWSAIVLLNGLLGCVGGVFLLLRRKQLLPWPALRAAAATAVLMALADLSGVPLSWMSYQTRDPVSTHVARLAFSVLANSVFQGLMLWLSLMAAEGLGRLAFRDHILVWRLFALPSSGGRDSEAAADTVLLATAASDDVLRQLAVGYLAVPVMFAYEVSFFRLVQPWLGWWLPSSALLDPNIAAHYFPAVAALARAWFAGFWEEALFRAVPVAAAALLCHRFRQGAGRLTRIVAPIVFGAIFVAQAVVFGAAHASYPAQPSYARVVELLLPSFGFAVLYLRDGLLAGVICHFVYDVVWMAMPIFLQRAPSGAWGWCSLAFERALVLAGTFAPLLLALAARRRAAKDGLGASAEALQRSRHGRWLALRAAAARGVGKGSEPEAKAPPRMPPVARGTARRAGAAALLCLCVVVASRLRTRHQELHMPVPWPVPAARDAALSTASQNLLGRCEEGLACPTAECSADGRSAGLCPLASPPWRALATMTSVPWQQHQYAWMRGPKTYRKLLAAKFLSFPGWQVRYVRLEEAGTARAAPATAAAAAAAAPALATAGNDDNVTALPGMAADATRAARAEEWAVVVNSELLGEARAPTNVHTLAEATPGDALSSTAARALAVRTLRAFGHGVSGEGDGEAVAAVVGCARVREASSTPYRKPNRVDWTFEWVCEDLDAAAGFGLAPNGTAGAEARVVVSVASVSGAGPKVVSFARYLKPPQVWSRADGAHRARAELLRTACTLGLMLAVLLGAGLGVVRCAAGSVPGRECGFMILTQLVLGVVSLFDQWPLIECGWRSDAPLANQQTAAITGAAGSLAMRSVVRALACTVLPTLGLCRRQARDGARGQTAFALTSSVVGPLWAIGAFVALLAPAHVHHMPLTAATSAHVFAHASPQLALCLASIDRVFVLALCAVLWSGALASTIGSDPDRAALRAAARAPRVLGSCLLAALAYLAINQAHLLRDCVTFVGVLLATSAVLLAAHVVVFRHHAHLVPACAAMLVLLELGARAAVLFATSGGTAGLLLHAPAMACVCAAGMILSSWLRPSKLLTAAAHGQAPATKQE